MSRITYWALRRSMWGITLLGGGGEGSEIEHDAVPLEHGDSASDAGFQAVDEGDDDEVQSDR